MRSRYSLEAPLVALSEAEAPEERDVRDLLAFFGMVFSISLFPFPGGGPFAPVSMVTPG